MKLALPSPCFLRNLSAICAPAVVSQTMWSSMPQAVETATSYLSPIVARSPRRPLMPAFLSSPDLAALRMPRTAEERVVPDWRAAFASSALATKLACCFCSLTSFSCSSSSSSSASWSLSLLSSRFSLASLISSFFSDSNLSRLESSLSASSSCCLDLVVASSRRLDSVVAVSRAAWKTLSSSFTGASSVVLASRSERSLSVVPFISS
mmetsp:Transcript_20458/g.42876  ORF Transcript_20458/g.42876 Transcript_20458/m.42876 type:complete len:208 (-) Transcript_20458:1232-1855(-)